MQVLPHTNDSATHWYYRSGQRCAEIIGKTTGSPRKPTIRDARELGLLPGVTGIIKLYPNDSLQRWKRSQDILAAVTTPRHPNETDEFFVSRVLAAADEECRAASDIGTRRHKLVEKYHIRPDTTELRTLTDWPFIEPYIKWFCANVKQAHKAESVAINLDHGYAGTMDLLCTLKDQRVAVVDLKNRKNVNTYSTDAMQLAAYRRAVGADVGISVVLGTEKPEILVKEWTRAEDELAWRNFELCLSLWKNANSYHPDLWKPKGEQE